MRTFVPILLLLLVSACDTQPKASVPLADAGPQPDVAQVADVKEQPTLSHQFNAFDFVDNRHLAHLFDANGALTLDMGTASALKYIQGRWNSTWHPRDQSTDTTFAYVRGVGATVRFPLISAQSLAAKKGTQTKGWKLALRLKPVGSQRCDLFMRSTNGDEKKFASLTDIKDGWGTYLVDIPDGLEVGQEHTVRLHFSRSKEVGKVRSAAAIDWIKVGQGDLQAPHELPTTKDNSWLLPKGSALAWYTMPGNDMTLEGTAEDADVRVRGPATLVSMQGASDLSALAGKPVRVEVLNPTPAPVRVEGLRFTSPIAETQEAATRPQYVLVWIIDTLRADHVKAYNPNTDVLTPNLDELIKTSALFKSATVQGNSSLPSSASVFASAYPPKHELITEKAKLPADSMVFGEAFKKHGWTTALFSSNGYVSNKWGFARGFDIEVNPIRENRPSDAEYLWADAKKWLDAEVAKDKSKPILLYMNPVDPHVPYDPPAAQLQNYDKRTGNVGKVSPRGTGQLLHDMAKTNVNLSADEAKYMHALYKGEITYNDLWLGKVIEDLKALGIWDKTMIIITSDHGEEFNEYGRFGHGVSVNQELVDVPFIIHYSPWTKAGITVTYDVETVDLLPTALAAAGAGTPDSAQGISLLDLIQSSQSRHPRPAFSYHNSFLRSARLGSWKYQLFHGDKDPLFELSNQAFGTPHDDKDVGDVMPIPRRMMRDLMAFQVGLDKEFRKSVDGFPNNHSAALAAKLDGEWP